MTGRPPLVDLHCHFVPGVDDGAPDLDAALRYLEAGLEGGVSRVAATPHLPASRAGGPLRRRIEERYGELEAAARRELPELSLSLAFELRLDGAPVDVDDRGLWLGPGGHVLVEYDRFSVPSDPMAPLRPLLDGGLTPVLAHPERYVNAARRRGGLAGGLEWMDALREAGVKLCPNAVSLTGRNGRDAAEIVRDLLATGRAEMLASDHHARPERSYGLGEAWELLAAAGAADGARVLLSDNPRAVLEGGTAASPPEIDLPEGTAAAAAREGAE